MALHRPSSTDLLGPETGSAILDRGADGVRVLLLGRVDSFQGPHLAHQLSKQKEEVDQKPAR